MEINTGAIVLVLILNIVLLVKILSDIRLETSNYKLTFLLGFCIGNMLFALVMIGLYYLKIEPESIRNDILLEIFKVIVPTISVLITSISLIITASNFNKSAEKSTDLSDSNQIMDMIKLNNEIYQNVMRSKPAIFEEIKNEIVTNLESDKFWMLRGMNFVKDNLFSEESDVYRKSIIFNLESLEYKKNSNFYRNNEKLIRYLKTGSNNSHKQIWLLLNYESLIKKKYGVALESDMRNLKLTPSYIEQVLIKREIFEDILIRMNEDKFYTRGISYNEAFEIINDVFDNNFEVLGNFFRSTHRIIKKINESFGDNMEIKKNYLGLLRAQLPESAIASIYYNATYTRKGLGLARQLLYMDFFGDELDFISIDKAHLSDSQHISSNKIVFYDTDYRMMSSLYVFEKEAYLNKKGIGLDEVKKIIEETFDIHKSTSLRKSLNRKN